MIQIGVIGSGAELPREITQIAEEVGEELAKRGVILICGGKGGVMEAACKGVRKANGISVGILPGIHPSEGNKYVTIKIPTNLGENRNYIVIQSVQAVICISGAIGTKIEAEYALQQAVPLITIPKTGGTAKKVAEDFPDSVIIADSAKDAVKKALVAIEKIN
ncbi:MAG: TIGR00725 family protein [Candidatus Helarchaeota archaeon]